MTSGCALSTAFAGRPASDAALAPAQILDALLRAGASGAVLDASLDPGRYEALTRALLARGDELRILAIESPCPAGRSSSAQLASVDREEAQVALDAALETVERAGMLGARFVVLRLGEVRPLARDWQFARDRFLRGDLGESLARQLAQFREDEGARSLDAAHRALDRLVRAAERAGVVLTIRNGRRHIDVPTARELDALLADTAGAPVAPLLDLPAAHLGDAMGFQPLDLMLATFGERAPLVYFGDACGPIGALPPGRGMLDLPSLAARLPKDAAFAFSPWPGLTVDETLAAVPALSRLLDARR
jgi:hypothetical protein